MVKSFFLTLTIQRLPQLTLLPLAVAIGEALMSTIIFTPLKECNQDQVISNIKTFRDKH